MASRNTERNKLGSNSNVTQSKHTRVKSIGPDPLANRLGSSSTRSKINKTRNDSNELTTASKNKTIQTSTNKLNPHPVTSKFTKNSIDTQIEKQPIHKKRTSDVSFNKSEFTSKGKTNSFKGELPIRLEKKVIPTTPIIRVRNIEDVKMTIREFKEELIEIANNAAQNISSQQFLRLAIKNLKNHNKIYIKKYKEKLSTLAKTMSGYVIKNWIKERKGLRMNLI